LKPIAETLAYLLLLVANYWMAAYSRQQDFGSIMLGYEALFLIYAWVLFKVREETQIRLFIAIGLLMRVMHLPFFPSLSDDIYRYFWDGQLWVNGMNPLAQTPQELLQNGPLPPGLSLELYQKLNSPNYHTIYPPLAQLLFWFCAWVSGGKLFLACLYFKCATLLAEIGTVLLLYRLLPRFGQARHTVLWYALNPLVIVELCGNAHLEGFLVFFTLLCLYFLQQNQLAFAALALSAAVDVKLLPLMFTPFFIRRLPWPRQLFDFWGIGLLCVLGVFIPLIAGAGFIQNFGSSVDLYFQRFEFNAGIFYALRFIGKILSGYNLIRFVGPGLGLLVLGFILWYAKNERQPNLHRLPLAMHWAIVAYLACSTIVHPWYLCLPLALSLFTPYRFTALWSGLVVLSYSHYHLGAFRENYFLIALEYLAVGVFGYLEWRRYDAQRS
jgi:alpha-1,6-mannosyltransferase